MCLQYTVQFLLVRTVKKNGKYRNSLQSKYSTEDRRVDVCSVEGARTVQKPTDTSATAATKVGETRKKTVPTTSEYPSASGCFHKEAILDMNSSQDRLSRVSLGTQRKHDELLYFANHCK